MITTECKKLNTLIELGESAQIEHYLKVHVLQLPIRNRIKVLIDFIDNCVCPKIIATYFKTELTAISKANRQPGESDIDSLVNRTLAFYQTHTFDIY